MNQCDKAPIDAAIDPTDRPRLNLPNTLCAIRLAGAIGLVGLALADNAMLFLYVFLLVAATDWIDGKLAIWLDQRTTFGARFDSVADAAMYAAMLFGAVWLKGGVLAAEWPWIVAAVGSYAISCAVSLIRFGRLPSHHTYSAKTAWMLAVLGAVSLFSGWAEWPLRVAAVAVAVANLESTAITLILDRWQADVRTVLHAMHTRHVIRQQG